MNCFLYAQKQQSADYANIYLHNQRFVYTALIAFAKTAEIEF